ncbi:LytR C-terminal domain-containing protein [Gardnerella vaginalis]|uniref:LytR C-terminal domain-containing protein n=1 Tax=Gardnerella vaginalis TaxID=2702 RepID=UPI0039F0FA61
MAQNYDERIARKEFMYQKTKSVMFTVGIVLIVATFISFLIQFHIFGLNAPKAKNDNQNYGVIAPCPVRSKNGDKISYLDSRIVRIRVLNGTKFRGFASAVGEALRLRGFNLIEIGNNNTQGVKRTTIYFGKKAVNDAYTLSSNFNNVILRMDDREDDLVDVVLGSDFRNLRPKADVPPAGAEIVPISNCKDADSITNLPKAAKHKVDNKDR